MKRDNELTFKLNMLEQNIQQFQQQINAIEQATDDLILLKFGIDELVGKEGNEIFAPIGRGIFVKAKITSEDLLVDVGERNFVKKNITETKELIDEQVEKLKEMKKSLEDNLMNLDEELTRTMKENEK